MEHLEGRLTVLAALEARQRRFEVILISHAAHLDKLQDLLQAAQMQQIPIRRVDPKELESLAHGTTHGGVMAVASPKPRTTPSQLLEIVDRLTEPPLLLLIEGIEDARNLGFVLRSAEALGAHAVLIKKHLWDFDPIELARPSSGAYERLPLVQIEDVDLLVKLQKKGVKIIGCIAGAKRSIYERNLARSVVLAIGGEKRGLSQAVREICDMFATVPIKPSPSSLSLSHAAAIVLGEANRQRQVSQRAEPSPSSVTLSEGK